MMKIRVIAEGKIKTKPVRELAGLYSSRITHYLPLESVDVKDEKAALKLMGKDDYLVVCDENGQQKTSVELARFMAELQRKRVGRLVFYIGGPAGVGREFKSHAKQLLALSKMTFPHEMAQVFLLEQVYRACTILAGEAYHK